MNGWIDKMWYPSPGGSERIFLNVALAPLVWFYRIGLGLKRKSTRTVRLGVPVISVGNLTLGGCGKTPLVIDIAERMHAMDKRVAVVSRGYGRKTRGVVVVQKNQELIASVDEAGDEPYFIATRNPALTVVVGEDRVAAAEKAIELADPHAIVCDDGFQHGRLYRDLDLVAVHARRGFGNRKLFPRGPLREPVCAIKRADLVVFTYAGEKKAQDLKTQYRLTDSIPASVCHMEAQGLVQNARIVPVEALYQVPLLAVCGIADPAGFFHGCGQAGLRLVERMHFPDHHFFQPRDLVRIQLRIDRCRAEAVVVTEKDLTRIPKGSLGVPVFGLRIGVCWPEDEDLRRLEAVLTQVLSRTDPQVHASGLGLSD